LDESLCCRDYSNQLAVNKLYAVFSQLLSIGHESFQETRFHWIGKDVTPFLIGYRYHLEYFDKHGKGV